VIGSDKFLFEKMEIFCILIINYYVVNPLKLLPKHIWRNCDWKRRQEKNRRRRSGNSEIGRIYQYFSVPHLFQLDSSGFQWIPLYSTGIYLCVNFLFLSTIFQVHSRSFQVIPVHSSSFQLILV